VREKGKRTRAGDEARDPLDEAIWRCWTFGEYAVNVMLELDGQRAEQGHKQAERARELYARKVLAVDYHDLLEKLEMFRLQADYLGYSRSRSIHYSPHNVEDCIGQLESLMAEVEARLKAEKRLP
jgi:hypothetical protein